MPGKSKYPITHVAIKPSLKQEVKKIAKDLRIPFNVAVEQALEAWLTEHTY
jgi:hypothetical protein